MNQNIDWEAVTTELKREIAALEFRLDGLRRELSGAVQERDSKLAVVVQERDVLDNDWRPR